MGLLACDGFSHYQTPDILNKWTTYDVPAATFSIEPAGGRNGGCLKRVSTSNSTNNGITMAPTSKQGGPWTPTASGVTGFALKIDDLTKLLGGTPGTPGGGLLVNTLMTFYSGTQATFGIALNPDGSFSLYNFGSGTTLAISSGVLRNATWAYVEVKWTVDKVAGVCIIHVNGVEIMNYSGVLFCDTYPNAPPPVAWTSIKYLGCTSTTTSPLLTMRMDSFYLLDQVAPNASFLGDINIKVLLTDADGPTVAWTPTGGANFANVNDNPPNGDTSYNAATALGTVDLYSFQPVGVTPIAAQQCIYVRRTVPGSAGIQSVFRAGSTNYNSPAQAVPNDTYSFLRFPYDTSPATGIAFTAAEIDSGWFGLNKSS